MTESVTLTEPESIEVNLELVQNLNCNISQDGRIEISATGGVRPYSFAWSTGATTSNLNNLGAGSYSLTLTDNNGCTSEISTTITEPTAITIIEEDIVNVRCEGAASGDIYLILEGGTMPYSFIWSNGSTNQDLIDVEAGLYSVTITDVAGCTVTDTYTINDGGAFAIESFDFSPSVSCAGSNDGFASLIVTQGQSIDELIWSNGSTEESLVGLAPGVYSVTVASFAGCTAFDSFEITEPTELIVQASSFKLRSPMRSIVKMGRTVRPKLM